MGCACQGGAAAGEQYQALAGDGTVLEVAQGRTAGTRDEARAVASKTTGAWVKRLAS